MSDVLLDYDNYIVHIIANENAFIEVFDYSDNQEVYPDTIVTIDFFYRGGWFEGEGLADAFSMFLFDRTDTEDVIGTGATVINAPPNEVPEPGLPKTFDLTPIVPRPGKPVLTQHQLTTLGNGSDKNLDLLGSGIYVERDSPTNEWYTYWTGSFKVKVPRSGTASGEINEPTSFKGQAQILDDK